MLGVVGCFGVVGCCWVLLGVVGCCGVFVCCVLLCVVECLCVVVCWVLWGVWVLLGVGCCLSTPPLFHLKRAVDLSRLEAPTMMPEVHDSIDPQGDAVQHSLQAIRRVLLHTACLCIDNYASNQYKFDSECSEHMLSHEQSVFSLTVLCSSWPNFLSTLTSSNHCSGVACTYVHVTTLIQTIQ